LFACLLVNYFLLPNASIVSASKSFWFIKWGFGSWLDTGHWVLGRVLWALGIGSCGLGTGIWTLVEHWALGLGIVFWALGFWFGFNAGSLELLLGLSLGLGYWVLRFGHWAPGLVHWGLGSGACALSSVSCALGLGSGSCALGIEHWVLWFGHWDLDIG
jgi:hypothetical protein